MTVDNTKHRVKAMRVFNFRVPIQYSLSALGEQSCGLYQSHGTDKSGDKEGFAVFS